MRLGRPADRAEVQRAAFDRPLGQVHGRRGTAWNCEELRGRGCVEMAG